MLTASLLMLVVSAESGSCSPELFRIERSKNANVVLFEGRPGAKTALDPDEPVKAGWLLLATTGAREELSFFEKLLAYGYEVRVAASAESAVLTLKALRGRTIRVESRGGCLAAVAAIGGAEAVLKRVYVTTDERGATPRVKSIDLFGVDAVTGEPRQEHLSASD